MICLTAQFVTYIAIVRSVQFAANLHLSFLITHNCWICFMRLDFLFFARFVALCLICLIMSNKNMRGGGGEDTKHGLIGPRILSEMG